MIMELTKLSLAPTQSVINKSTDSTSSEYENNPSRKRKLFPDHLLMKTNQQAVQGSVDLQLKDPLPLDWEQCLDLDSGRLYYLNRKTLRKTWNRPNDQKLDLDLNISSLSNSPEQCNSSTTSPVEEYKKTSNSTTNMVALACLNCHLLVILSKSFPSCPNCKYVHSLPVQQSPPQNVSDVKPTNTFSFLS
ncbi:WW domain [Quillaja saponaria]|uniref:WW domain n=1 Tax=Quillaja saponaria TaxID=32244 RepID=A0AAD7QD41_QUISA|nr:WW domain [Quillaja saponaria]